MEKGKINIWKGILVIKILFITVSKMRYKNIIVVNLLSR